MKNLRSLTFSLLCGVLLLTVVGCGTDNDIDISISETEEELVVSANYPDNKSSAVHRYVKSKLRMTDISNFRYLEVKNYQTPDHKMNFQIKSRDGYLKIVLDKTANSHRSYELVKDMGKGLQHLFSNR